MAEIEDMLEISMSVPPAARRSRSLEGRSIRMTGSWTEKLIFAFGSSFEMREVFPEDPEDGLRDPVCMNASKIGKCLGSRSIEGEVTTMLAKSKLALISESAMSTSWTIFEGSVVLVVIVTMGIYNILSRQTPSSTLMEMEIAARRAWWAMSSDEKYLYEP